MAIALAHCTTTLGVRAAVRFCKPARNLFEALPGGRRCNGNQGHCGFGLVARAGGNRIPRPLMLDSGRSQAVRTAAVECLAAAASARWHLSHWRAKEKCLSKFSTRSARCSAIRRTIASARQRHDSSSRPTAAGGRHLPPLSELAKRHGNAKLGEAVFNTVGTCVKCHTVNHVGKDVGPNLSEIGNKATRDFLYESILFPSAAIAHNYETWRLELENGNVVTGIIVSETKDAISLKTADAIVRTYKPSEIETRMQLKVSLMPADLQKLMTTDDLVDVVEYLTTLKKSK